MADATTPNEEGTTQTAAAAQSGGGEGFTPITSQEEFDRRIKARIDRVKNTPPADYAELKAKAKKYDELESANQTLEERVASIEAANKALENEKERARLVKSVAKSTGVPEPIVSALSGTDEDSLTAQAQAIAENYKTPGGAPKAPEAGKFPKDEGGATDEKRQFVRDLFKN